MNGRDDIIPRRAEAFDTFYFDGQGVRSQAGHYYVEPIGIAVGPYHTEHAAKSAAHCSEALAEEMAEGYHS